MKTMFRVLQGDVVGVWSETCASLSGWLCGGVGVDMVYEGGSKWGA